MQYLYSCITSYNEGGAPSRIFKLCKVICGVNYTFVYLVSELPNYFNFNLVILLFRWDVLKLLLTPFQTLSQYCTLYIILQKKSQLHFSFGQKQ